MFGETLAQPPVESKKTAKENPTVTPVVTADDFQDTEAMDFSTDSAVASAPVEKPQKALSLEPIPSLDDKDVMFAEGVQKMGSLRGKPSADPYAGRRDSVSGKQTMITDPAYLTKAKQFENEIGNNSIAPLNDNTVEFNIDSRDLSEEGKKALLRQTQEAILDAPARTAEERESARRKALGIPEGPALQGQQLDTAERLLNIDQKKYALKKNELKELIALAKDLVSDKTIEQAVKNRATTLAQLRMRLAETTDEKKKAEVDDSINTAQRRLDVAVQQMDNSKNIEERIKEKKKAFFEEFGMEFDSVVK